MDVQIGPPRREFDVVTNTANPSVTTGFGIGGYRISHLRFPAAMTSATVVIEASSDNGATWLPVTGLTGIAATTSTYVPLTTDAHFRGSHGLHHVRIKTSGQEAAARTIGVVITQAQ